MSNPSVSKLSKEEIPPLSKFMEVDRFDLKEITDTYLFGYTASGNRSIFGPFIFQSDSFWDDSSVESSSRKASTLKDSTLQEENCCFQEQNALLQEENSLFLHEENSPHHSWVQRKYYSPDIAPLDYRFHALKKKCSSSVPWMQKEIRSRVISDITLENTRFWQNYLYTKLIEFIPGLRIEFFQSLGTSDPSTYMLYLWQGSRPLLMGLVVPPQTSVARDVASMNWELGFREFGEKVIDHEVVFFVADHFMSFFAYRESDDKLRRLASLSSPNSTGDFAIVQTFMYYLRPSLRENPKRRPKPLEIPLAWLWDPTPTGSTVLLTPSTSEYPYPLLPTRERPWKPRNEISL